MTRVPRSIPSVLCCAASIAFAQSLAADPLSLSMEQMDQITAGQAAVAAAAASALASAQGDFTVMGTSAKSSVGALQPLGQPSSQTVYVAVNSASANATAQGPGSQTSVSVSGSNEQPVPDDSVIGTTVQSSQTVLGTTIAFKTQVSFGSLGSIYFLRNPRAMFGGN